MKRKWEIERRVKRIEREALVYAPVDAETIAAAEQMGRDAFARGVMAAPALDLTNLKVLLANADAAPILAAWSRGWHAANLQPQTRTFCGDRNRGCGAELTEADLEMGCCTQCHEPLVPITGS